MPNIWYISDISVISFSANPQFARFYNHDPDNFPDPMGFKPERFLDIDGQKASKLDQFDISFGFGRR